MPPSCGGGIPQSVRPGDLVLADGAVVGRHEGHQHFTIGQRKGVGVAFGRPIYVVDIDPDANRVTLGDKQALGRNALIGARSELADRTSH